MKSFGASPKQAMRLHHSLFSSSFHRFEFRQTILDASFSASPALGTKALALTPFFQDQPSPKSRGRAFLQSLVLPGWGQYYTESKAMMRVFIVSEVLLWGSYLGFTTWSNWLEDDYRTFAVNHAGIKLAGKPDRYFVDIGNFDNLEAYNQAQLRDRDVSDLYPTETNEFFWQWDNTESRRKFEDLRIRSDEADNRAEFVLAGIFVNHLVSAVHSTLAAFKFNKRLAKRDLGYNIYFDNSPQNRTVKIELSKRF
ncbi:MAG: hypothetical protein ACE5IY_03385 [bacterium]